MNLSRLIPALSLLLMPMWVGAAELSIADLPESRLVDTQPRLASGMLVKYGQRLILSPCRDQSFIDVEDVSPQHTVSQALERLGVAKGRHLYAEFMGYVEGQALKVTGINLVHAEGRCQLPGTAKEAWRASGNEPGWVLAAGGDTVQVKRFGQAEVVAPYVPFAVADGHARFDDAAAGLAVRFDQELCFDTMADAVFGWKATVTIKGASLHGCAWQR